MKNKELNAWYLYDFASSAFSTTVITVFLGPYLTTVAKSSSVDGLVDFFGLSINPDALFAYGISISVILQVFILPLLGSIVDLTGKKREFLGFFVLLGSIATMLMYFITDGMYMLGFGLLIIANLAYGIAMVIYNSILNDITTEDERDAASSRGFAVGYVGGGLLLALNLVLYTMADAGEIEVSSGLAVRISLCSAGMWWFIFSLFPVLIIKNRHPYRLSNSKNVFKSGFFQFFTTMKKLRNHPQTMLFLIAYLLYNDGVQAVVTFASQFGIHELDLTQSTMITIIFLVQFVAFGGAFFFGYLSTKIGSKNTILTTLVVWIVGLIYAYSILNSEAGFYALALSIGFIMGGTQALSRSLFSKLIPVGEEAEYFSIYEISERGTSWLGSLVFGLSLEFTNSYRIAILSLLFFFILGGILLMLYKGKE
jgi:UMF1 family MFS transporter